MTDPGTWQAVVPVPPDTPPPVLPEGFTGVPYTVAGSLHGYVTRNAAGKVYPLAWCQNGSPDAREWRWAAIPGLDDPASVLAPAAAPAQPQAAPRKRARKAPDPEPPPAVEGDPGAGPDAVQHAEPADATTADGPDWPFTMLGHDHGIYSFMGRGTDQLTQYTASQLASPAHLYKIAARSFWVRRWPKKGGFDVDQATSDLMDAQHRIGIYSADRIRGRGAWWDNESQRAIVHLGDRLIVGGVECGLHDHGTRYIYEAAPALPISAPLRNSEAAKLTELCVRISWNDPLSARLLAGWIVCANVCGAIRWKPNLQLLGPKESGKSTVVEKIVWPALGKNVLYAVGGTTEASIRAMLRADAIPIIIDDMDSSTARARENNQALYNLMRVFSGEGGGAQYKASQSGGAPNVYKIHSCYIYSGITLEADKGSDISRIAVLKIKQRTFERDQFSNLLAELEAVLTPEFSASLFARCIRLIPQIRANAETFAQHFAAQTGSRRCGDVNGHLIAGCYALHSDGLISREAAAEYISRAEVMSLIHEEKQAVAENNDGLKCLAHLMEQVITDTQDGRMVRASVFDLIRDSKHDVRSDAAALLRRCGIILSDGACIVANEHSGLRDLFNKSPWPHGWASVLRGVPGAEPCASRYFGARNCRGTKIPLASIGEPSEPLAPTPPPDDEPELL